MLHDRGWSYAVEIALRAMLAARILGPKCRASAEESALAKKVMATTVQNRLFVNAIQNNFEWTSKSGRRYVYLQLSKLLDFFSSRSI